MNRLFAVILALAASNAIIRWGENGTMRNDDYRRHLATRVDISWSEGGNRAHLFTNALSI